MRFLFFIYSIVMNITCLFRTWPYSCIWLRNIDIFGARIWAYSSWYGLRMGYHGSTETIREAAKNKEESISEWLVQAIDGERERENTRPQKIRNKEKRPKTRRTNSAPPRKKKENVQHRKKKKNSATPKEKKKGRREKKRKKEVTQLNSKKKKVMKKRKRIRRYLLIYVCHSLIYE